MTSTKIENWEQKREQLQREYPELTRDQLIYEIGKEEELIERLHRRLNKNKEEIRKWLSLMG